MTTSIINYINEFNNTNRTSYEDNSINWFNNFDYLRYNEDGSITCKIASDIDMIEEYNLATLLCWENSLEMAIAGEDGCLGNWDMYSQMFNMYTNMLYLIPYSVSDKFMNGEEVTIYGREVDEEEFMDIMDYMNNG